jgi:hypothetical protein
MVANVEGDIIEIIIRDSSYRKLEQFKMNLKDKKLCRKIFSIIEHKYNFVNTDNQPDDDDNNNWLDMNNDFFK